MDYKEEISKMFKKGIESRWCILSWADQRWGGLWRLVFVKYGQAKSLHFYLDYLEDVRPIHLSHNNPPLFVLHVHVTFVATTDQ
jgi:hypothetical protein